MNLTQENHLSEIIHTRASRASIRNQKTSSTRFSSRKTPSSMPAKNKRDSFPNIHDNFPFKENFSNYNEGKKYRNMINTADWFKGTAVVPTPPKRQLKVINKKKYEALKNLIDELEGNIPSNDISLPDNLYNHVKPKPKTEEFKNQSIGVQVEIVKKNVSNKKIFDIQKGSRKFKIAQNFKKENIDIQNKLQEAEIRAKEALKEFDRLKREKNYSLKTEQDKFEKIEKIEKIEKLEKFEKFEKRELMPIPNKTKIDFYKKQQLQTIYESRFEDQLDSVILIQSYIRG